MPIQQRSGGAASQAVARDQDMFIGGWFTETFEKGIQPDYGYPKNHLPEVPHDFKLEVQTGFLGKR